jgi:hypothetical protein
LIRCDLSRFSVDPNCNKVGHANSAAFDIVFFR